MHTPVRFLFHSVAAANFAYGIYYDIVLLKFPDDFHKNVVPFGGRWKYLTFWNMVISLVYYSFSILNDVFGSSTANKRDRKFLQVIRDYAFGSIVFPVGMFVAMIFWTLWAIDRELVFPAALDSFFPSWLNHVMHTSIVPFALVEMLLIPKAYPKKSTAMPGLVALMTSYTFWIFYIAFRTNFWVYPVFAVLHWGYRLLFIAGLNLSAIVLFLTGEKIHYTIWGQQTPKNAKGQKPIKDVYKAPKMTKNKRKQN